MAPQPQGGIAVETLGNGTLAFRLRFRAHGKREDNYRWRLQCHLLPFFENHRLDEIDRDLCLAFKAHLLKQSRQLRETIDAGADLRDSRKQKLVPLSASSIRKMIDTLAAILEEAVEDGHIDFNPARGKRMRVHVPKPKRTYWRWMSWPH